MSSSSSLNRKKLAFAIVALVGATIAFRAEPAFASVESSLSAIQSKMVGTILPLAAVCGLAFAGLSFVAGRPNARSHLSLAIIGAIVGFGAESIVNFIRSLIN